MKGDQFPSLFPFLITQLSFISSAFQICGVQPTGKVNSSSDDSSTHKAQQKRRGRGYCRKKRLYPCRNISSHKKNKCLLASFEDTKELPSRKFAFENMIRVPPSFKHLFVSDNNEQGIPLNVEHSKYVSMDCEMVGVGKSGKKSAIARVTIIDWNNNLLMETYVRPNEPVTDYRTAITGITEDHLYGKLSIICDIIMCRMMVKRILQNKILVGHRLKNDLDCLGITHPWYMIRDTATYEPYMKLKQQLYTAEMNHRIATEQTKQDELDSILFKYQPRKLKDLIYEKFSIHIQNGKHSSFEDAIAALELYKLDRVKWELSLSKAWNSNLFIDYDAIEIMERYARWCTPGTNPSDWYSSDWYPKAALGAAE